MIYNIEVIERRDPSYTESRQEANSPAEALQKAGFIPDSEYDNCSGAEPRNEYGNPWYPHRRAEVISSQEILDEFKEAHPELRENEMCVLITGADLFIEVEGDKEDQIFSVSCSPTGNLIFETYTFEI